MRRALAVLAVTLTGCSTPLAQLKRELGPRAATELDCPEREVRLQELEHLLSSTRVLAQGCGREVTFSLVESRWTRVRKDAGGR